MHPHIHTGATQQPAWPRFMRGAFPKHAQGVAVALPFFWAAIVAARPIRNHRGHFRGSLSTAVASTACPHLGRAPAPGL
eukprot:293418-Chlamydomonas_euryale.AAC.2